MTLSDFSMITSIISSIVTIFALFFAYFSFRKQHQLYFFSDYTKRYQEIILNLPHNVNDQNFDINILQKEEKEKLIKYMRAYFDLCSEEYHLWRNKYIENKAWKEWEIGIKFSFSKPAFRQTWILLCSDTIYEGDFKDFIRDSIGI